MGTAFPRPKNFGNAVPRRSHWNRTLDGRLFRQFYLSQISNEIKALADNARELALVRDTILFVPNISVPRELLNLAISDLVT